MAGRTTKWTEEKIKIELLRLVREGKTYSDIRNSWLEKVLHKRYGGLIPACDKFGIDCSGMVQRNKITEYRANIVCKEDLDSEILMLFESRRDIKKSDLDSDLSTSWITSAAERIYGSWTAALYALNIKGDPDSDVVLQEIIDLYQSGLSAAKISGRVKLSEQTIFDKLRLHGVDVRPSNVSPYPYLTEDDSLCFLRQLINELGTQRLTVPQMKSEYRLEVLSLERHFGSISKAVKKTGTYVLDKGIPRAWSRDFLLEQIQLGHATNQPLNVEYLMSHMGTSALTYARGVFGSWENAVIKAGVDYSEVRQDANTYAPFGHKFESIFDQVLLDLGVQYQKYAHERLRPDYVIGKHWIDAKLSIWTVKTENIQRYEPHCEKLTIVYFRGSKTFDQMITDKTRMVSVYHFVNQLPDIQRKRYEKLLDELGVQIKEVSIYGKDASNRTTSGNPLPRAA